MSAPRRERDATVYWRIDGDGLGADRYVYCASHSLFCFGATTVIVGVNIIVGGVDRLILCEYIE